MRALALAAALIACATPAARASGPPRIDATWATEALATSVKLHLEAYPEGLATTVRFEYVSQGAYEANLAAGREGFAGAVRLPATGGTSIGAGSAEAEVARQVTGLVPNGTYRYRALAFNSAAPGGAVGPEHALTTEEVAAVFSLPDSRGWEMVSPVDKNGGQIQGFGANYGGDVLQAATGGGEVTYSSSSSFGQGAQGAPAASQYLGGREASTWSVNNVTAPQSSGAEPSPGSGVPFRLFSPDLSSAIVFSGGDCLTPGSGCANPSPPVGGSGAPAGYQDFYLRDDGTGTYRALITQANAPALALSPEAFSVSLAGATPDLTHVVLSTCARLTPDASEVSEGAGCNQAERNLYEWSGGALRLINPSPGAALAAGMGAVSSEGNRVYFTTLEDGALHLLEGAQTKLVSPAGSFQVASSDGSVAFFLEAAHLYRYQAASEAITDLTPGGEVQGVLGASADGSYLYFKTPSGIELWHAGAITTVTSGLALPSSFPPATGTARVSADGTHLAFLSGASLTGFDNLDASTKAPDTELFLYDAAAKTLSCASCNPSGARPVGSASVPGAIANGEGPLATQVYKPRVLSAGGNRLFFDSSDALALQDTNGVQDVYEWEAQGSGTCSKPGGCIGLLSSGRDSEASSFVDASASGGDAFFLTAAALVPSDPGSSDLYDAREGGGFPIPPTPVPCTADACQPLISAPEDPTPGTLVASPGNPALHIAEEAPQKKRGKKKHRKGKKHGKKHRKAGK